MARDVNLKDSWHMSPTIKRRPDWVRRFVYCTSLHIVLSVLLMFCSLFVWRGGDDKTADTSMISQLFTIFEFPTNQIHGSDGRPLMLGAVLNVLLVLAIANALLWGFAAVGIWYTPLAISSAIRWQLNGKEGK
jgi:hypothetical protein